MTAAKLADDAVVTANIVDANVTTAKLAADAVTTAKILDANVTNAKLANSTVSYGGIQLALGANDATPAFDLADATNLKLNNIDGIAANTTNFSNSILIGQSSTGTLSSADYNVGLGYGVFNNLSSGTGNMSTGYNALNSLTTGDGNVAIGRQVLSKLTQGGKNVGIGRQAGIEIVGDPGSVGGNSLVTGSQNTYIGAETVPSASNVSNETVIGYGGTGQGTGTVTLGNTSVTRIGVSQDNTTDLGSSLIEFKDLYIDGTANLDIVDVDESLVVDGTNISIDATSTLNIDNSNTSNGITIGTATTGVPVSIGHATSETTINDNLTVTGDISGSGSIAGFNANLKDVTAANNFDSNTDVYNLQSSDNGKVITISNGTDSNTKVTIPVNLGAGFNCLIIQKGNHYTKIEALSGNAVSIVNRSSEVFTAGQYAVISIINIGNDGTNDIYIVSGDTRDSN